MFDLEQSISEWRQQMLAAGITSSILDELESHLREEIKLHMKSGSNERDSFKVAVQNVGQASALTAEFRKARVPLETQFIKLAGIASIAVASIYSLWTLLFLFSPETSLMMKVLGLIAVATTLLSWRYSHKFLPVIANHTTRTLIGFGCCLGGLIWIRLFIACFLPRLMFYPAGMEMPVGQLVAGFLWGWTAMAVLGSIGHGLEKAAERQSALTSL